MLQPKYRMCKGLWGPAKGQGKLSGSASSRNNRLSIMFHILMMRVGPWQSFIKELRLKESKRKMERLAEIVMRGKEQK